MIHQARDVEVTFRNEEHALDVLIREEKVEAREDFTGPVAIRFCIELLVEKLL